MNYERLAREVVDHWDDFELHSRVCPGGQEGDVAVNDIVAWVKRQHPEMPIDKDLLVDAIEEEIERRDGQRRRAAAAPA